MTLINRTTSRAAVALETTLLVHGVPRDAAQTLAQDLSTIIRNHNAEPALIGVINGQPTVAMTDNELATLLESQNVPKLNTANLGLALHNRSHGATTVSATMELAAAADIRIFATGGIGGVHKNYASHLDISADLAALARFPVAVVTSGVKSLLDVESTREALETLGVPVVGFRTDTFPAFYLRDSAATLDARFDDIKSLAAFTAAELARTNRGIVIANPIPAEHELPRDQWTDWLAQAEQAAAQSNITGRDTTPFILDALHRISAGATLRANIELVKSNTDLAARIAAALP